MRTFWALVVARNKEFYRDNATLIWGLVFPFIVILGFKFGYSGQSQDLFKVGVFQAPAAAVSPAAADFLKTKYISFVSLNGGDGASTDLAISKLRHHQYDLLLDPNGAGRYWVNETSAKGSVVEKLLLGTSQTQPAIRQTVTGKELRYVDWLIPGIMAMNMMFSSLFGVGYTLVRYRKNGVLKRLKATPVTAFQFLTAQVLSRLSMILLTASVLFGGTLLLVRFQMNGSYLSLLIFMIVGAIAMISLGLIVASRISSEEVAEGVLNVLTWPMMFLSGIWFSLEGASPGIRTFSKFFPLTHIVDGMRAIIIDGASLASLWPQMLFLLILSAVFLTIGSIIFKWS